MYSEKDGEISSNLAFLLNALGNRSTDLELYKAARNAYVDFNEKLLRERHQTQPRTNFTVLYMESNPTE